MERYTTDTLSVPKTEDKDHTLLSDETAVRPIFPEAPETALYDREMET